MRQNSAIILLAILMCGPMNAHAAESYYFSRLDVNDGLSQNCVNAIIQDRTGFMWFGTRDGLNRYDGTAFKVFRNDFSGDGLTNNFITSLYEHDDGCIYIGTDMGVCIYDPESEHIKPFSIEAGNGQGIRNIVTMIGAGRQGHIMISSHNYGLFDYDVENGTLTNWPFKKYGDVKDFFVDGTGRIWIAFWGGLYFTDGDLASLQEFRRPDGNRLGISAISKILLGSHGRLYVASENDGVHEISLRDGQVRKLRLEDNVKNIFVRTLMQSGDSRLWIGSESGVYIYDTSDDSCIRLYNKPFDPYSISDNAIYSIFMDRDNGIWIGSFFGGINHISGHSPHFSKYYPSSVKGSIEGYRIREICGKGDELWIGTEDAGLFRYDRKTKDFTSFGPSHEFRNIHGLCLDGNDLWVGTFGNGVRVIDTETGRMRTYMADDKPLTIRDNYVFSIHRTSIGHIYIGTANTLIRHDVRDGSFTRIRELDGNLIYDIYEDSDGNLWVATYSNGIFLHDAMLDSWRHYAHSDDYGSLPTDKILSIFEDSMKRIWVTTQGGGVCRMIPGEEHFEAFNSTDGLPNDVVFQIQEDKEGMFWMTTNKGLVHFDPQRMEVLKVYTMADGLLDGQFNYKSSYQDSDGEIYFGMTSGMVSFKSEDLHERIHNPSLFITDFFLFNKPVLVGTEDSPLQKSITFTDKLVLRHDQNTFSFKIASLNYCNPMSEHPVYRLEGMDSDWIPVPETWTVSYSLLPYGRYTLCIRSGDQQHGEERRIEIEIRPPFWLTKTAFAIYLLLFCSTAWFLWTYVNRRNALKRQIMMDKFTQGKEKELYESRINFFIRIAHEIRTPLTLIKGPLESVLAKGAIADKESEEDLIIMQKNVNRLHDLTNQLLDFRNAGDEGMVLDYVHCDVVEAAKEIFTRFNPLARQKGFNFLFESTEDSFVAAIDREVFTKIVSNLLSNAIKYGKGQITVHLECPGDSQRFCLWVENEGEPVPDEMMDGIFKPFVRYTSGRNSNIPGVGIGLPMSRFLAERHGGTLTGRNMDGKMRFILDLPVEQEKAFDIMQQPDMDEPDINEDFPHADDGRPTILVVEDDIQLQKFTSRHLGKRYGVLVAGNGEEALKLLSGHLVDIVVSDVMMPVMDGMELCRKIKSDMDYCHIPVILLTARTLEASKIEGAEAGADRYMAKPFSMEYLFAVIDNILRNRDKLKSLFTQYPTDSLSDMTKLPKADEEFLARVHEIIREQMADSELKMTSIAEQLHMSRTNFYRKIKGVLDLSPNEYLRIERLKEAAHLLSEGDYQVSEVCYMVGFNSLSYFSKRFYEQFGVLPKDYHSSRQGVKMLP